MGPRLAAVVALTALLGLAGCSEYHGAAEESAPPESSVPSPEPSVETSAEPSAPEETETSEPPDPAVNDPEATPADQVGGTLASGRFSVLTSAPPTADIGGNAYLAQTADGTTVTLRLTGLRPDTDYVSHLHRQPCAQDAGGPHFAFNPGGSAEPPNEVHLEFTSDDQGSGEVTVTNDRRVGTGAASVVVHATGSQAKLACADFV